MDILDGLESQARGPYSGVIGYFSPNGGADLSVTNRSAVFHASPAGSQRLSAGIGGAITTDSGADGEIAEIHTKAKAILGVLGSVFPGGNQCSGRGQLQDSADEVFEVGDMAGGQSRS
jgi:anthranilate synthase component 1/para-aminobenzoate synthetase